MDGVVSEVIGGIARTPKRTLKEHLLRPEGLVVNSHVRKGVDQVLVSSLRPDGPTLHAKGDLQWRENI